MPRLKPIEVQLSEAEEEGLKKIVNKHQAAQQIVKRARIVLAAHQGKNNRQIMREVGVSLNTVRLWRSRWQMFAAVPLSELSVQERLEDDSRPGAPAQITAEQRCQIEKLACTRPEETGRPITQWTNREIADEIIKEGIVQTISPRHAGRLLKRSRYQAASNPLLANTREG
jgi:putative transposase